MDGGWRNSWDINPNNNNNYNKSLKGIFLFYFYLRSNQLQLVYITINNIVGALNVSRLEMVLNVKINNTLNIIETNNV